MTAPNGKYDDVCKKVIEETEASFVLLTVVGGNKGHGCSVACTDVSPGLAEAVSTMLHMVADRVKDDMERARKSPNSN